MAFAGTERLAGLALFLMAAAPHALADELPPGTEITWYSADIPPLYIFSGPLEGTGYGDVILDLVGGAIATRVYPGVLGEALSSPDRTWRMEKLNETPLLVNLARSNRIAFFFLSPVELAYYRQIIAEDERWVGIPIEGLPSHVEVYTACSKTDAGALAIAQIDSILSHDDQWSKVTSVLSSWESRAQLEHLAFGAGAAKTRR